MRTASAHGYHDSNISDKKDDESAKRTLVEALL